MKKLIAILSLALAPLAALAAGGGTVHLDDANIDVANHAAIQRGAKLFVNYCMGCHSAQYFRYSKLMEVGEGEPDALTEDEVKENLMFAGGKIGDQMTIAMKPNDAAKWFGAPPPDLTLVARIRGEDWLYTYLRSFYTDESRPFGVNNVVFPSVGMPHVLADLQGVQKAVYKDDGHGNKVVEKLELTQRGSMTPEEYDNAVRDLVTFMAHTAEPMKLERQRLGYWVLGFLAVFFVLAYLLKKEYWKDIH